MLNHFSVILGLVTLNSWVSPGALAARVSLDKIEASVNSSLILHSDVQKFRNSVGLRAQLDPLFGGTAVSAKGPKASHQEIVDFLINERLISNQFPVTDPEVEQEIGSIQSNNEIDRETLKRALKEQGFHFDEYFELIRASVAKRNLIDREIRTKVTISDDDLKNYFINHYAGKSAQSRAYKLKIITLSPENFKDPRAARETADRALREIKGGEPFEEVAKRVSDDPTASSGGDLGTLTEDQMNPQIRNELKKLHIGQVSGVLGSASSRFFILKLEDIVSSSDSRFEKVKEEIRAKLSAQEYQRQVELWLERQRHSSFIHRSGIAKK